MAEKFTELDFFAVKENLKEYLKNQENFKDYDFAGSNINVLLDVLSYNTVYNNIYTNMAFSEMFLDSAQLRDSAVSRSKELNYVPRSRTSSFAVVQVEVLNVIGTPAFITLPKYSKFQGKVGNITYTFTTNETYAIDASSGSYCSGDIPIYEGAIVTEAFEVKTADQRFVLSNPDIDTSSIFLTVRATTEQDSVKTEYSRRDNLFGVRVDDPVFYLNEADKGKYEISFGRNSFGVQPAIGNVIEVSYRVSSGDAPNGVKTFSLLHAVEGYATKVTTMSKSTGGAERESVESIKYFAPKSIQIQDRAVLGSDYMVLLKNRFPEITAIAVYGGEEVDPPQYGRTIISLAVNDMDGFSENVRQRCLEYLKDRCVLGIEPIIRAPEYLYVSVDTSVKYDLSKTSAGAGHVKELVNQAIKNFSKTNLNDFGKVLRASKLYATIDGAFDKIISNETNIRIMVSLTPALATANKYEILFGNELERGKIIKAGDNITTYTPCVTSTTFHIAGVVGYVMDDGNGVLNFVKNVNNTFTYVKRAIGTIDYTTGKLVLNKLNITEYSGSGIEFSVTPKYSDVTSPKSRIIKIRDVDIGITVSGVHGG
ncbi:baseplate wedge [Sinorhizobium phage phiM12]|uniref:Baseplate wedge n=1 Tax=Sinorhizobium phage phiM12 TaxID=1357423 RepID=S5MCX5_9CAUD|nr:baseplate wedge subunit [Sinorhizobium phage phiM12]AGR47769.1 baseplate wedge [Sinorhizobium phage phiM12]AKF13000.1 baseplate wedge [Sinorhizobium phage phiM19]